VLVAAQCESSGRCLYYRSGGRTKEALAAEEKVGKILADSLLAKMPLDSNQSNKDFVSNVAVPLSAYSRDQEFEAEQCATRLLKLADSDAEVGASHDANRRPLGYVCRFSAECPESPRKSNRPGNALMVTEETRRHLLS
jgi:hypothetical protein